MQGIDWILVGVVLAAVLAITFYAKRYNRSVSDFLAANRMAGRYLLTVSAGFGGAASLIAGWEMTYNNGLPASWWFIMWMPLNLFIALTGFVIYRFRETRALTLAQFFEMRYSRKFRLFSGFLCWLSGILNFGVFPAITTRFILCFFGFPEKIMLAGFSLPLYPLVMFVYMLIALYIACAGGQICIMLTDFFQGMLQLLIFVVIMFFLLYSFGWGEIMTGLHQAPANASMLNPFKTAGAEDFNIWFFLISFMATIYTVRAWQGNSGYNAAARTPHEAVMSGVIATWRLLAWQMCMILIPLAAYGVLHTAAHPALRDVMQSNLSAIPDAVERGRMLVPVFLMHVLPPGLLGLFAIVVIVCAISCDDTCMHSWGTIFVQDVVMPLRKKPFPPKQHMLILRLGIIGVAVFAYIFSLVFELKDFIQMYFALTGAIYLGGAGAVVIGGLYWKRGTVYGAWAAMILGTLIGLGGMAVQQCWADTLAPWLMECFPDWGYLAAHQDKFPINGQYVYLITILSAIFSYIAVSLLGPKRLFNMDKMLHRGVYADEKSPASLPKEKFSFAKLIGINENFTRFDRFVAWSSTFWSLGWWGIFVIVTILSLTTSLLTDGFWEQFWWWKLVPFPVILGTLCTIWLSCGGVRDAVHLLRDLKRARVDETDNGFVPEETAVPEENGGGK